MSRHSDPVLERTWAEVNLTALRHNAMVARQKCGHHLLAVIKANAYGHGVIPCAQALLGLVDAFAVANVQEAMALKEAEIQCPIWILGACLPWERESVLRHQFHAYASSLEEAREWSNLAAELNLQAKLGLFLDTGMGREGFFPSQWNEESLNGLSQLPNLEWKGVISHFSAADEDVEFSRQQITLFHQLTAHPVLKQMLSTHAELMLANSAGIIAFGGASEAGCTQSRAGLMLYGISPIPEEQASLEPVLTWKARITLVRTPPLGWGISYGRTHRIDRENRRIATVSVGYADGYPRILSGKGAFALVRGSRCSVLGRVTMDSIMLDVTHLPEVQPGDEVVLLGAQGDECIPANELAELAQTIPYEILTGLQERVIRYHLESDRPSAS